ncbi:SusC/RagA family TonB-linked outer membrane protein [Robertkochia solimangrovi]|uniref:SusC/RagA family TonB-linked outer membrane protein n=1 Tax=Robertkochia solimangrovi TaxID=2213046 RepID=UPI0013A5B491|nr:SusC/RagA family TonB-linked outer membrane protein [Robertkochia solimangrovi]
MRTFIFLICTTVFGFTTEVTFSQEKVVVDKDMSISIDDVFSLIKTQTKYRFIYPEDLFEDAPMVNLKRGKFSIGRILKESVPEGKYDIILGSNNRIIIKPKSLSAQQEVSGKVTDNFGVPLEGVAIMIKGTKTGVFTDIDGYYEIIVPDPESVLVYTYLGFKPMEVTVGDKTTIDISLQEELNALEDVVVNAGYYTVTQKEQTGNISSIGGETLERQPVGNLFQALQGRMAGVAITQTSGVPGARFDIQIRGMNSITSGNQPLYVVDGIPFMSDSMEGTFSNTSNGGGNPLQVLNPSDIERIEVLKDADATSIYGSRGANGVVLITTKKGNLGKAKVNISVAKGASKLTRFWDMMSTPEYLEMRQEAFANDGITPTETNAPDLFLWDQEKYTDWQRDLLGGTAELTEAQISVSGGNSETRFRIGASFREVGSVFPGDFSNRKLSGNLSVQHTNSDGKLKIHGSMIYSKDANKLPYNDPTFLALYTAPNAPEPYNEDGSLYWDASGWNNPYGQLMQQYTNTQYAFVGNLGLEYSILNGLQLKLNAGYNRMQSEQIGITPVASRNPAYYTTGFSQFGSQNFGSWILEPQLNYQKRIGNGNLNLLMGASLQENNSDLQELGGSGYTDDNFIENLQAAPVFGVTFFQETDYKYLAFFGRINYNLNHKYILNITGRRDGSSRFGPNRRWGNFGAIGAAWLFGEEDWFADSSLSYGKFRASYGTSGNDRINDYGYIDSWTTNYYDYNGATGVYPSRLYNENYGWEINKKLELALELGFWEDRLGINVAWYNNRSSNMLVGQPLPLTTGFSSIQNNLDALVQNTGLELELRAVPVKSNSFNWEASAMLSIPKNKLVSFPNLESSVYANTYIIGEPLNTRYLYNYQGVDAQTGLYQFEDVNGDGIISALEDKKSVKQNGRKYYGNLANSIQFRNWQLQFMLDFVKQTGYNYMYDLGAPPGYRRNQPDLVLERWQQPGDNSNIQAYTRGGTGTNQSLLFMESTAVITDASYARLRQASLVYDVPEKITEKLQLSNLRIYLEGQNLFTWTDYKGFDPETQSTRILPPLTTWMAGIQLSF